MSKGECEGEEAHGTRVKDLTVNDKLCIIKPDAMSVNSHLRTSMEELILSNDFIQSMADATGQLGKRSKRIYENDAKIFAKWLKDQGLSVKSLTRSHMIRYRSYLDEEYAKATAARMLSVARRILQEQVISGNIPANPAKEVKGFSLDNESPHIALTKQEAKDLLASIETKTPEGKRDYALISLLLRTGIRRSECVALNIGDLKREEGHIVATVRHGKGDKRRKIKLPVDVFRALEKYMEATGRTINALDEPLFIGFGRWKGKRITDRLIERTVQRYGAIIGIKLTPHDLRATFNTLSREGGATLEQRQWAMGHSDPRTTQRYDIRKENLDDNAVDYIKL